MLCALTIGVYTNVMCAAHVPKPGVVPVGCVRTSKNKNKNTTTENKVRTAEEKTRTLSSLMRYTKSTVGGNQGKNLHGEMTPDAIEYLEKGEVHAPHGNCSARCGEASRCIIGGRRGRRGYRSIPKVRFLPRGGDASGHCAKTPW